VPSIVGQATSVEWLLNEVGLDWVFTRVRGLTAQARAGLAELSGVRVLTPDDFAGLLSFEVEGVEPDTIVSRLAADGIIIRSVKVPRSARAAFGFYTSEEDVARFIAAVGRVSAGS
jgi:selenocysteine lyase/cysteine desulfurase